MKSQTVLFVMAFLLLGVSIFPAMGQTESIANHVVINEIDINPPGDDSASINEWVELYNPTNSDVDIGGWDIASTTVLKKTFTIPQGTIIKPEQHLTYSYQSIWFTDVSELVELRDQNDNVIDTTFIITDLANDFSSWQRTYDGLDTDSESDWEFSTSNAGSTNGKLTAHAESVIVSISSSVDKPSYLFGETAVISGKVSEQVFIEKPFFQPEQILITITGLGFQKTVTMYPDFHLGYQTELSLQKILGVTEGLYNVSVDYAGAHAETQFNVGDELISVEEKISSELSISTNKSWYIPGESVTISASSTEIIPFEGLKFQVLDPNGITIVSGDLFPIDGQFSTDVFLTTVNPTYGTYEIVGEYFGKGSTATFELVEDFKEDKIISLWTDKEVYGLGDTVTITGRLNDLWINALDLEIVQTKNLALGVGDFEGGGSVLKILDVVRLAGDGTFQYSFDIPDVDDRLGDYSIKVSKDVGSATKSIVVAENPEEYVTIIEPLFLNTDKIIYDFSDEIIIGGQIKNPDIRSSFETPTVKITIYTEDGKPLEIIGLPEGSRTLATDGIPVGIEFTAIPDVSGRFSVQTPIPRTTFSEGNYVIKAQYLELSKSTVIRITDQLKTDEVSLLLDKEVYGLAETVHLTGLLPPIGESSVSISVTKPDGSIINSGATLDNQRFSWEWYTPITEKPLSIKSGDDRSVQQQSNFGIYKIKVNTDGYSKNIFFKVSSDPENDSLQLVPLTVSAEKALYKAGEKLKAVGSVIAREQGDEGLIVPDRVTIKILDGKFPYKQIHEAFVYPDQGGNFQSLFELPPTIFSEGEYKIKALYQNKQTESFFSVANDFVFGLDEPVSLIASTDKTEYYPGDTVVVTGKPNKLIYLEKFDVSVIKKSEMEITCGSFICGKHLGPVTTIRPSASATFSHAFLLDDSPSSVGIYEVTIDADFETKSIPFTVVEKPLIQPVDKKIIEKYNRIPDTSISIITQQKTSSDDREIAPRVLMGSLLTPSRGEESNVNLRVSSESNVCIIGQEFDCLIKDSTRVPGSIYQIVEIDGQNYKIRYSGPDARFEKFTILPESSEDVLPDASWSVDVIKDEQPSRLYYKISYVDLE